MNLKVLLSDKFVEFSTEITGIHTEIKELKAKFQADLKALTEKAEAKNAEFEAWQKEQEAPKAPAKATADEPAAEAAPVTTRPNRREA